MTLWHNLTDPHTIGVLTLAVNAVQVWVMLRAKEKQT